MVNVRRLSPEERKRRLVRNWLSAGVLAVPLVLGGVAGTPKGVRAQREAREITPAHVSIQVHGAAQKMNPNDPFAEAARIIQERIAERAAYERELNDPTIPRERKGEAPSWMQKAIGGKLSTTDMRALLDRSTSPTQRASTILYYTPVGELDAVWSKMNSILKPNEKKQMEKILLEEKPFVDQFIRDAQSRGWKVGTRSGVKWAGYTYALIASIFGIKMALRWARARFQRKKE